MNEDKPILHIAPVFGEKKIALIILENQSFVIFCRKNMKKNARNVCGFQKMHYLCNRNRERKQRKKNLMVR
ncbi:MAG TPA: hypothetical protein OIM59_16565 [Bacteroides mediterraneensis]|uniref:hypothetical protein n=1 Tax=Bacteroides mediterraneensis TaxID=1841856 RepID=UPI002622D396|nr:hypothetical protein [Bacteroides mediterraneensis]HJH66195.1 hypothetical protein [Bacteroides mediterraneensis]